jgi:hypothetical protein
MKNLTKDGEVGELEMQKLMGVLYGLLKLYSFYIEIFFFQSMCQE